MQDDGSHHPMVLTLWHSQVSKQQQHSQPLHPPSSLPLTPLFPFHYTTMALPQIKRDNIARVAVRTARQERQQRKQHFAWKKNYKEEGKQHTNKLVMEFTQMQKEEEEKKLEEAKQRRANIETAMEVSDAVAASTAHHHHHTHLTSPHLTAHPPTPTPIPTHTGEGRRGRGLRERDG